MSSFILSKAIKLVNFKFLSPSISLLCGHNSFCSYNYDSYAVPARKHKPMSAEEAVSVVKSNDVIFIHGAAATPRGLIPALVNHGKSKNLKNVKIYHVHTEGAAEYNNPEMKDHFKSYSLFTGANCRNAIKEGRGDYVPIFLSEIPLLFNKGIVKPDVSFVQITPPDENKYHSLGTSVDTVRAALRASKYIIGQVNTNFPRTFGDALIHESHFDALVQADMPLPEHKSKALTETEIAIGKHIAENLVENGCTLQMGIGAIPDAVLIMLKNHKDLGIHSEMFSDGLVDLFNSGCVTNKYKKLEPGKIVASFVNGTKKLYDFVDNNPSLIMRTIDWVNKEFIIAQNPKVTAINSCIEVDITGQVCSDSIGTRIYSGFGGQVDFIRGSALGLDGLGKPILAMPSLTSRGESKIVNTLKTGAGVVTTRAHAHYIVTEYGIAYLFGKSLKQRAHALINISHPNHRESLEKAAFERFKCMPSAD